MGWQWARKRFDAVIREDSFDRIILTSWRFVAKVVVKISQPYINIWCQITGLDRVRTWSCPPLLHHLCLPRNLLQFLTKTTVLWLLRAIHNVLEYAK